MNVSKCFTTLGNYDIRVKLEMATDRSGKAVHVFTVRKFASCLRELLHRAIGELMFLQVSSE